MEKLYETKISDKLWIAYDIPANLGWIAYITSLILLFIGQSSCAKSIIGYFEIIFAILLVIGIAELISERIAKLDRVLPKIRLYRGFGALTLGGALGFILASISFAWELSTGHFCVHQLVMLRCRRAFVINTCTIDIKQFCTNRSWYFFSRQKGFD